jgi:hypothetical protein
MMTQTRCTSRRIVQESYMVIMASVGIFGGLALALVIAFRDLL